MCHIYTVEFEMATFRLSHSLFYQTHPRKTNQYASAIKNYKEILMPEISVTVCIMELDSASLALRNFIIKN